MAEERAPGWAYHAETGEALRLLERHELWGQTVYEAWSVEERRPLRLAENELTWKAPAGFRSSAHFVTFAAAAGRIADALGREELVSPFSAPVLPLPHQLYAVSRALSGERIRYLLADEVGLGKTIEAGLILRELKARGLVRRTLVVAPAGLVGQWREEMKTRFGEEFRAIEPGTFADARQLLGLDPVENLWRLHDQVICSVDSVKPVDGRRGWTREQVARVNRERHEDLVTAGWDLVIVDEAHRLGGSSENVARYRLGEALGLAAPYLLLLSATPHQGKTDAFRRLLGFLDPEAFTAGVPVNRENVAPVVIRTEKRNAIDAEGNPLFRLRQTRLLSVRWDEVHGEEQALYEAVTEYVREGYDQAVRQSRNALAFLMILMQRLVTSSLRAIRTSLERRLAVLELPEGQLSLFPEEIGDEWEELTGQEQLELALKARLKGLANERREVELLLSAARRCESRGPDAKAEALLAELRRLEREEEDPELKVLLFTEFVPTQEMLAELLTGHGYQVAVLNGSMSPEERRATEVEFRGPARVLISTDAGGEGLNFQFCHVVVNYDLPWNPMKLEQRIGRVDRIGQTQIVQAVNLALEGSVEERVREVLEEKLRVILEEFGVDKLSDVLDAGEAEVDFDRVYIEALRDPAAAAEKARLAIEAMEERIREVQQGAALLATAPRADASLARRIAESPVPFWTERMRKAWAAGHDPSDGEIPGTPQLLNLIPRRIPGDPIAAVELPELSDKVAGTWSLWKVSLGRGPETRSRYLPVFVSDEGRTLQPTARAVWDALAALEAEDGLLRPAHVSGEATRGIAEEAEAAARAAAEGVYRDLLSRHEEETRRRKRNGERAFEARRTMIERVGLLSVRHHRLQKLQAEREAWEREVTARSHVVPDLTPVVLVRLARRGELK
ncbi:MAG TPA: helicase-related protein [Thermoanaerobaculia bacterium]|nr:helicase-related protein [Thermoanaerobaculia bacterium]